MLDILLEHEYGRIPPVTGGTRVEMLDCSTARSLGGARSLQCHVVVSQNPDVRFRLDILVPKDASGRLPVVLAGDGCWHNTTDEVSLEVLRRGYVLAVFSRVEILPDLADPERAMGLHRLYPGVGFGAIAAWAWGYHRAIDALETFDFTDVSRIAVTGHSRGGKAALLAGATDERIALTHANNSGCCGAGCFRWEGEGSEKIADITRLFPYWFQAGFEQFSGRECELPFDQHYLKAAIAPRLLITTEALQDSWANPSGTWQTHLAAAEAYRFLEADDNIAVVYRQGGHLHGKADWFAMLDFADQHFCGLPPHRVSSTCPFTDLPKAFHWGAPARTAGG